MPRLRSSGRTSLSLKLSAQAHFRTIDWLKTDQAVQAPGRRRPARTSLPLMAFVSQPCRPATSRLPHAAIVWDGVEQTLAKVGIFQLADEGSQHKIIPVTMAMWKLPTDTQGGTRVLEPQEAMHQVERDDPERSHPLGQIEVTTFDVDSVNPSIYKDRRFQFVSISGKGHNQHENVIEFRKQVQVCAPSDCMTFEDGLESALSQGLDLVSTSDTIIPRLPNGVACRSDKAGPFRNQYWKIPPLKAISMHGAGRDHHKSSTAAALGPPQGSAPLSIRYAEHLALDEESGFMVDVTDPSVGVVVEQSTPPSRGEVDSEGWDDDLVAGAMDD